MAVSPAATDPESQLPTHPPTPTHGYERAIDRDISGYSWLRRLTHYLYIYTRCLCGLTYIIVSGLFARDATAAIEKFWEDYCR